jgi:RHS repeat-associated protein
MQQQILATDPEMDRFTFELVPGSTTVDLTVSSDGVVDWTPNPNLPLGNYSFTVFATDEFGSDSSQVTFNVEVVSQLVNTGPAITSPPIETVVFNTDYVYHVEASDPDLDPVSLRLVDGPAGMVIDPYTGVVTWTPVFDDLGTHRVAIQAADPFGASDVQIFDLDVTHNHAPMIVSDPIEWGVVGQNYSYQLEVIDEDGHQLSYQLDLDTTTVADPFISDTGLITGGFPAEGTFTVSVRVFDNHGGSDEQTYSIVAYPPTHNFVPEITSAPQIWAEVDTVYQYPVTVMDPNNSTHQFSILDTNPPLGNEISFVDNVLVWDSPETVGEQFIAIRVEDGQGGYAHQWFTLLVLPANVNPTIQMIPTPQQAYQGGTFAYDVIADDPDGLGFQLAYMLDQDSFDRGMSIDEFGHLRWFVDDSLINTSFTVDVTVTDWRGGSATESFGVVVIEDTEDPLISISVDAPQSPFPGDDVVILVHASDNAGVATKSLQASWNGQSINLQLDDQGRGFLTLPEMTQTVTFLATAIDVNGNMATTQYDLPVYDPSVTRPPTAAIFSPFADQEIEEPIEVVGTAVDDPSNSGGINWDLEVIAIASQTTYPINVNQQTQIDGEVLGTFDPSLLPNGRYAIRLTVTNAGGIVRTSVVNVTVTGNLKLGDVQFGFEDVTIPVRGFPITISRTYDSKKSNVQGDFGYGWQLDIDATQLEVALNGSNGGYGYAGFTDGTRVVVTLPDGSQEGYTFYGQPVGLGADYLPRFQADYGNRNELIVNEVYLRRLGDHYIDLQYGHDYNPADPIFGNAYELRQRNGTKIVMNATDGRIATIEDREGNLLTFTGQGILHSAGTRGVFFERDAANRITAIVIPNGDEPDQRIEYRYSVDGDLIKVIDRNENETEFVYDPSRDHFLTDIHDALGRTPVITEYFPSDDANAGRIKKITDSALNVLEFVWNREGGGISFGQQNNTVPLKTTLEHFNDGSNQAIKTVSELVGGNETYIRISVVDLNDTSIDLGVVSITKRTFNADNQLLTETIVVGADDEDPSNTESNDLTTEFVYDDETGELLRTFDVRRNDSFNIYNDFGQLRTAQDIYGNTTYNQYSGDASRLLRTTTGHPSSAGATFVANFKYDPITGDLSEIEDRNGLDLVLNDHNAWGDVIYSRDANGRATFSLYDDETGELKETYYDELVDHDGNPATAPKRFRFLDRTIYDDEGQVIGTTREVIEIPDLSDPTTWITTQISNFDSNHKNALGQDQYTVDTEGFEAHYEYDVRGLTIETRSESVNSQGVTSWWAKRTVYDAKGRAVVTTDSFEVDQNGAQVTPQAAITGTRSTYDAWDRVVKTERIRDFSIDIINRGDPNATSSFNDMNSGFRITSMTSTQYDNTGRVEFSTDANGLMTSYTYNRFGESIETRSQTYDETGVLVELVTRTVYDEFGRAVVTTDPFVVGDGNSDPIFASQTVFDDLGRVRRTDRIRNIVVDIVDGETEIDANFPGEIISSTETIYGPTGLVDATIDALGGRTDFEYNDPLNRRTATIGPAVVTSAGLVRHRSETVYDSKGRVQKETTGIVVNAQTGGIDYSNKNETSFRYDHFGNLVKTTFNDGSFTLNRFDVKGRRLAESTQFGLLTNADYVAQWSDSANSFAVIDTSNGNAVVESIPTRLFTYDDLGRLTSVALPADPNNGVNERPTYEYGYDGRGNQVLTVDPLDHETHFGFNDLGQQDVRRLPLGFGSDGMLGTGDDTSLPEGEFKEIFSYDDRGRQEVHISFEGVVTKNIYNDDLAGRLSEKHFFQSEAQYDNGAGDPAEIWSYTYDARGRIVSVVKALRDADTGNYDNARSETTTYNDQGLVQTIDNDEGQIQYLYDDLGRQISVSFSGSNFTGMGFENVTEYTYDELGRLKTVTALQRNDASVSDTTTYQYDPNGNMESTLYSNGVGHHYDYDRMNRLEELTHFLDDGDGVFDSMDAVLASFVYELRDDGKRESAVETFQNGDTNTFTWDYDDVGRLIGEELDSSDNDLDYVDSFVYDLTGNRLETTRTWTHGGGGQADYSITYVPDANDRVLHETKVYVGSSDPNEYTTYGYSHTQQSLKVVADRIVDLTEFTCTDHGAAVVSSCQEFSYDVQGRMAQVTTRAFDGAGQLQEYSQTRYEYDSAGNRVVSERGVSSDGDEVIDTTTRTEFLTDTQNHTGYSQVLQESEFDGSGNPVKKTVYTIGHDQINQTVYSDWDSGTAAWNAETQAWFGTDGHGSVRVLYDALGAILNSGQLQLFHFDAYGNLLNFPAGVSPATSYLYSGESFDFHIGQQYLRARWYDPTTGRFNRLDPFSGNTSDPQSFHKYAYVHGDPVQGVDPTGESYLSVGLAVVGQGFLGIGVGVIIKIATGNAKDITVNSIVRDFFIGAAVGGIFMTAKWGYTAYQASRAARIGSSVSAVGAAQGALTGLFGSLSDDVGRVIVDGVARKVGFKFVGNSFQKEALQEYLEFVFSNYIKTVPNGITQVADDFVVNSLGQKGAGKLISETGEIVLSKSANLSTLAEELIHFAQLSSRNLIGQKSIAQATEKSLELNAKKLLRLWGFEVAKRFTTP